VDLEKAFDGVPREETRRAMLKLEVEEWLVPAIMSRYTSAKTVVRTVYDKSDGTMCHVRSGKNTQPRLRSSHTVC